MTSELLQTSVVAPLSGGGVTLTHSSANYGAFILACATESHFVKRAVFGSTAVTSSNERIPERFSVQPNYVSGCVSTSAHRTVRRSRPLKPPSKIAHHNSRSHAFLDHSYA